MESGCDIAMLNEEAVVEEFVGEDGWSQFCRWVIAASFSSLLFEVVEKCAAVVKGISWRTIVTMINYVQYSVLRKRT
eukprot:15325357-Ditylum_brightwellii.AAC.2